jgi:hypothetical protein
VLVSGVYYVDVRYVTVAESERYEWFIKMHVGGLNDRGYEQ